MAEKLTTCTFCGVGCGLYLETQDNRLTGAYPSTSHPANAGRLCLRGWHVHEVSSSPDRLVKPLMRKSGEFHEVGWDEAINFVAARLLDIRQRYGPDSIAFLNSPRCSNEEAYLLQKLARALVGTNNVDHGAGVYCNNSVNVLLEMLGAAACTNPITDLARSDVIVVDGVDLARQLPTIAGWVIRAKLKGARLIVIDSRRHRVAENADLFLQIKPGTEALLYAAMAKVIVDRGLMNAPFIRNRCIGFEPFLNGARQCDLLGCADVCGVTAGAIETAATAYASAGSAALLYSTGIESRGRQSIQAIVNLVLLCGQLGKPGAGLYPLAEQNNLQGVCDMGMIPDRLPGYVPVADADARSRIARVWGAPVPASEGIGADLVLGSGSSKQIKAIWLDRYDPVSTALFGDPRRLEQCELVVTQHLFTTGIAGFAHVILPTTAFGEERVTFTSTERRVQIAEKVINPPPGPMPAWEQLLRVAQAMGADWRYASSSEIMDEIAAVIPFYGGVSYENLSVDYGRQWPCTTERPLGTARLFEDATAATFRFAPLPKPSVINGTSHQFPLCLAFGHSLYYWHQNALVQHSETLKREYRLLLLDYPDGFVELNTDNANKLQIRDGEKIQLFTVFGSARSTARVTPEIRGGVVFVPYFVRKLREQLVGADGAARATISVRLEKDQS